MITQDKAQSLAEILIAEYMDECQCETAQELYLIMQVLASSSIRCVEAHNGINAAVSCLTPIAKQVMDTAKIQYPMEFPDESIKH